MNSDSEGGRPAPSGKRVAAREAERNARPGGSRMRNALKGIALTLAGCGALVGGAAAEDTARIHDQMRGRVLASVGIDSATAAAIREALRKDPQFDRLLKRYRRESLDAAGSGDLAEDAVQDTLLKIWQGRPEVFLLDHRDVIRYVRASARRNLWTGTDRARARCGASLEVEPGMHRDPGDYALSHDLLEQLLEELDETEQKVLAARLSGLRSQRDVAGEIGETRYAAATSGESLERKMRVLLRTDDD